MCIVLCLAGFGQEPGSLKKLLIPAPGDCLRWSLFIQITGELFNDPGAGFQSYYNSALSIARRLENGIRVSRIEFIEGTRSFRFEQLTRAGNIFLNVIPGLKKSGDRLDYARPRHYLAGTYANQDDSYTSIDYYKKTRLIYEETENEAWLTKVYATMGWASRERSDVKEAMDMYRAALAMATKNNSLSGLFDVYHELGNIYIEQGNTAEAGNVHRKALEVAEKLNSSERIAYVSGDLAILSYHKKDYPASPGYHKVELELQNAPGNQRDLPMVYDNIPGCFFELRSYDPTIYYATKALAIETGQRSVYENAESKINIGKAQWVNGDGILLEEALEPAISIGSIDVKHNALKHPYLLHQEINPFEEALAYYKSYKALQDSIINLKTNRQIEEIEASYKLKEHKQKIIHLTLEKQNAENKRNMLFFAFILTVILVVILFVSNRQIRIKNDMILRRNKKIAEAELEKAKAELALYAKMLSDKNRIISKLKKEYDKVKGEIKVLAPDTSKKIKKLIKSTLLTDKEWDEFKELFEQVYPSFFIHLRDKYPGLTHTEEKLFALSKLKLKNKEIGSMLGVSPSSVAKSKNRLGKKIEVAPGDIAQVAAEIH